MTSLSTEQRLRSEATFEISGHCRTARISGVERRATPDALARLCTQGEIDQVSYAEARRQALSQAEVLVQGLRDSLASISSQAELADYLIDKGISGPAYLAEIAEEQDSPLLMLPTSA